MRPLAPALLLVLFTACTRPPRPAVSSRQAPPPRLYYPGNGLPANPVQGDIVFYNGTVWTSLAPALSGQFLQTAGGGANPFWASLPVLAWTNVGPSGSIGISGSAGSLYISVDSTGGTSAAVNLPSAASEGQAFVIALRGASNPAGVAVSPGSGNSLPNPTSPGVFLGVGVSATLASVGMIYNIKYSSGSTGTPSNTWVQF